MTVFFPPALMLLFLKSVLEEATLPFAHPVPIFSLDLATLPVVVVGILLPLLLLAGVDERLLVCTVESHSLPTGVLTPLFLFVPLLFLTLLRSPCVTELPT